MASGGSNFGIAAQKAKQVKAAAKAEGKARRVSFLRTLNEGRKLVKAGRHDEGIAKYREALKIDPASPKVLGELGYAALQKGDLALAESSTRRAIDLSRDPKGLGAMYYNLGRIEAARGELHEARAAYERSLEVRPGNATVQARLDDLKVDPADAGPSEASALCSEIRAEWECVADEAALEGLSEEEARYMGVCDCGVAAEETEPSKASPIVAAALLTVDGMAGSGGSIDATYLAVRTRDNGWQLVRMLVNDWVPGAFGISNDGSVDVFMFEDLAPMRPGHELVVKAKNSLVDTNMGINTIDFEDAEDVLVCYAEKTGASCARFVTAANSGTEILLDEEPVEDDIELGEIRWAVDMSVGQGEVTVEITEGAKHVPASLAALVGKRAFDVVMASDAADRTRLH